jgi:CBS domain-containing protein
LGHGNRPDRKPSARRHVSRGTLASSAPALSPRTRRPWEVIVRIQSILSQKGAFVASIGPDASVFEASRALSEHRVGALVVSTDGASIEGILSERDVARSIALHGERAVSMSVADLMTADVFTCSPQDTVDHLMGMMTERRVRHLPVIDDSSGALLGIISIGDVVKHRVGELEQEAQTLHQYIELGR